MTEVPPPRLLDQVRQVIRLKHMSMKTEDSYVHYIRDFILYHNKKHPRDMGVPEIRMYLSHLAIAKNVAASTQNVAHNALLFLYQKVLTILFHAQSHLREVGYKEVSTKYPLR